MGPHIKAAIEELDAEIRRMTEARETLLGLFGGASRPGATPARAKPEGPARARKAGRLSLHPVKPRDALAAATRTPPPKAAKAKDAGPQGVSDTGARILKFLDKSGPQQLASIVAGTKLHGPGVSNSLKKLVKDGLAEDNDGHFRCTDKGFEAAI